MLSKIVLKMKKLRQKACSITALLGIGVSASAHNYTLKHRNYAPGITSSSGTKMGYWKSPLERGKASLTNVQVPHITCFKQSVRENKIFNRFY
jgi:hypothetical protein